MNGAVVPEEASPTDEAVGVAHLAIPTRGPGPGLVRLVRALGPGTTPVRVYVDDPDEAAAEAVRAELADAGRRRPVTVIGAAARRAHREVLAEASGRPDAVDAALDVPPGHRWRVGALRNLVLLDGVGRGVVSVDDDVLPQAVPLGSGEARVGGVDPTRWMAVPSRQAAWQGLRPVDLAALHGATVGRSAGRLAPEDRVRRVGTTPELEGRGDEPVVATSLGIAGDPGASRLTTWLGAPRADRRAALQDLVLRHRAVVRGVGARTVTDAPWFMAPCFAVDGRAFLPPFVPVRRNTDGTWGVVLQRIVRSGLVAHLPWAVRHDPETTRTFTLDQLADDATGFRLSDLLILHALDAPATEPTPRERLAGYAARVDALASASDARLRGQVEVYRTRWLAGMAAALQGAAEDGPTPWRDAVAVALRAVAAALDVPTLPAEHASLEALRGDLRRVAVTMEGWEALWGAGISPARTG